MSPLKVVCLISGGKDSLFSILHCIRNGHDVIALANLHPRMSGEANVCEDLDSYMYQTVGHKIIPLYEQALGLPLYRQEITGSAVNQSKSYGQSSEDHDETESLVPLLQRVQQHHPHVNAVSTGAILSDYQRTRVESVATRLGLTSLSYLWQWPNMPPHTQSTLLEDMRAAGQDSRIIKVASGGLDSSFLWCNVADIRTVHRIDKAVRRFGSNDDGAVLGEGGEYETLAVTGPAPLWKGSIEVAREEMKVVDGEAGSASLLIKAAAVSQLATTGGQTCVRTPPLLEPAFETLLDELRGTNATFEDATESSEDTLTELPDHVCCQYLIGPAYAPVAEQMASIMNEEALSRVFGLQSPPLASSNIAYVSIVLRRMSDFAAVNAVYTKAFRDPNPPARITLADSGILTEGNDVVLSFTCVRSPPSARQGLHVQSQSYWAPANIGPYSQAVAVPASSGTTSSSVVYVAGQIPLIPASMDMASPEAASGDIEAFVTQAVLSAQHFVRIGRAMGVRQWNCGIAFITADSDQDANKKADTARRTWQRLHRSSPEVGEAAEDDGEDFDVWDLKQGAQRSFRYAGAIHRTGSFSTGKVVIPRLEIIRVEGLPRGASIEWAVYGLRTAANGASLAIPHFEHLLGAFKGKIIR